MKKIDYIIIFIVLLVFSSVFLAFGMKSKKISNLPIENEGILQFEVTLKGVNSTRKEPLFKENSETFLTIRNVPYKNLKIIKVQRDKRKTVIPVNNPHKQYILVDDPAFYNQIDYHVLVEDEAKITNDGAVIGGNKIKIGIPVILEGFDYKLNGVVSNIIFPEVNNNLK